MKELKRKRTIYKKYEVDKMVKKSKQDDEHKKTYKQYKSCHTKHN